MAQKKKIKPAPASSELASSRDADSWTLCKQQGDKLRKCGSPNASGLVTYEFPLDNLSPEFILASWGPGEYLVRYLSAGKSSGTKRFKLFHPEEAEPEGLEVSAASAPPLATSPVSHAPDPFSAAMENAMRIQQMANASAATTMEGMAKIMAMANAGASRTPDPSIAMLAPLLQRLEQRLDALERRDSDEDDEDDEGDDEGSNENETSERKGGREGNPPAETFPVMTPSGLDMGAAIANFVNQAVIPKGQQIVEVGLALAQNHLDERKKASVIPPLPPVREEAPMLGGIVGPNG